ncbi:hypothetical protein HOY82DRAFT_40718 [Tuber indicum]|nr:hypothetical protein HOY82DRAFT_40718 [Tuber indicum]
MYVSPDLWIKPSLAYSRKNLAHELRIRRVVWRGSGGGGERFSDLPGEGGVRNHSCALTVVMSGALGLLICRLPVYKVIFSSLLIFFLFPFSSHYNNCLHRDFNSLHAFLSGGYGIAWRHGLSLYLLAVWFRMCNLIV